VKRASLVLAIVLLGACTRPTTPPNQLLGRWDLGEAVQDCAQASMEFTTDGHIRSVSGQQTLEATATYTPNNEGFLIALHMAANNGKPNCQGISAEYVSAHFAPFILVTVNGSTLSLVMLDGDMKMHEPRLTMTRSDLRGLRH